MAHTSSNQMKDQSPFLNQLTKNLSLQIILEACREILEAKLVELVLNQENQLLEKLLHICLTIKDSPVFPLHHLLK